MRKRVACSVAVATSVATLGISAPALAGPLAGERTFQQTYPVASVLCARVSAGTEGKHLKRFAARVLADCATLESNFLGAQSTVLSARAAILAQMAADRAAIAAACPVAVKAPRPLCPRTLRIDNAALETLRHQKRAAARRYYRNVEAGRDRFWNEIRALPGEHHARTDAPIPLLSS